MENKQKKIYASIILIIILIVSALIYYFYFYKDSALEPPLTDSIRPFPINKPGEKPTSPLPTPGEDGQPIQKDKLFQITKVPSISSPVFLKNKDNYIRYIESTTGNIYDVNLTTRQLIRISNKTIPGIVSASWSYNGKKLIGKIYTKTGLENIGFDIIDSSISTTTATSTAVQPFSALRKFDLDSSLMEVAFQPGSMSYFSLSRTSTGVDGNIVTTNSNEGKSVFSSPLTEWLIDFSNQNAINLTSKVSSGTRGYMYRINPENGSFIKMIGTKKGLTTLSNPNGSKIFYSESLGDTTSLSLLNILTGSTTLQRINTLPEKCVWLDNNDAYCSVPIQMPKAKYPDDWYKGKILFTDMIYFVQTSINYRTTVAEPLLEKNAQVDGIELKISADNKILVFKNKQDLSLWALDLTVLPPKY